MATGLARSLRVEESNLAIYMREISRYRPLSSQEESRCTAQIRAGDDAALESMVKANLRFVVSVARNYLHQGMALSDLINEGNLGLIKAARRFDEKKNFKFISYAVWWIRQSILQGLANQSRVLRVPVNRVATIYKIGRTQQRLEQKLHRQPNHDEVAAELDVNAEEVLHVLRVGSGHSSLDAPVGSDGSARMVDMLCGDQMEQPGEFLEETRQGQDVGRLLRCLSPRERRVIRLYFGIAEDTSHTLDEIAMQFRITRERVRQIKELAIAKLRRTRARILDEARSPGVRAS
jgi:RNA polymerase primary sigma factor